MTSLSEWTFRCHVCGRDRPNDKISVFTTNVPFGRVMVANNVRYCNDQRECADGARRVSFIKRRGGTDGFS